MSEKAGIDTSIFTPHSTRAEASSNVLESNVVPLKMAGWKKNSASATYYKKLIHKEVVLGQAVLAKGSSLKSCGISPDLT